MSVKATIQDQLKGNLNKKFGDNLPIPFIEKVMLADDIITLSAAIYFNLDEYSVENFDDFKAQLGDVHFYAMMAFDREYTATSSAEGATVTDNAYSDIISGKRAVLGNLQTGSSWESHLSSSGGSFDGEDAVIYTFEMGYPNGHNLYDLEKLAEWELADTYYNEAGKPVNKLVNTIEIPVDEDVAIKYSWFRLHGESDYAGTFNSISLYEQLSNTAYPDFVWGPEATQRPMATGSTIVTNAGFIAFSSILDLNDTADDDYTETDAAFEDNDSMKYLYGSLVSDLNYVSFFKDGAVNESRQFVYVKPSGEIVPNAVQALNGYYYAPSKVDLPKIVALFKSVSSPPIIEDSASALATILATNAANSTLLTRINLYLNTFYEKSSATPLGKYYLKLRKRLAAINILVKEGVKCSKQIVTNPIVQDFRGTTYTSDYEWEYDSSTNPSGFVGPDDSGFDATNYIYTPSVYMQRMTGSLSDEAHNKELVVDKGYLFVNYEKLLKQQSNLAHLVDVQKIEDYFGHNCLTSKFYLDEVNMRIRVKKTGTSATDTSNLWTEESWTGHFVDNVDWSNGTSDSNIEDSWTTGQYASAKLHFTGSDPNVATHIEYNITDGQNFDDYYIVSLDGYGNSYIQLRNFNLPVVGALSQTNGEFYKLMCFEFQNIIEGDFFDNDGVDPLSPEEVFKFRNMFYTFKFDFADRSLDVFDDIRAIATSSLETFNNYAEMALDHCSYNETDNVFNQFFINAVEAKFGTAPGSAPFLYAPLVYNYLLDIFTNAFDGDKLEIFEATRKLSDTIAPWAGTRDAVETFATNFDSLITKFLAQTGNSYYKNGGGSRTGYPESLGWGAPSSEFSINSSVVDLINPVGVDLSDYGDATSIEWKCAADGDCDEGERCFDGICYDSTCSADEDCDEELYGTQKCYNGGCLTLEEAGDEASSTNEGGTEGVPSNQGASKEEEEESTSLKKEVSSYTKANTTSGKTSTKSSGVQTREETKIVEKKGIKDYSGF